MADLEISLWEQKVYEFGIEVPPFLLAPPSIDLSTSFVFDLSAMCPGAPYCGNPDAPKNCTIGKKIVQKLPLPPIPLPNFLFTMPPMMVRFTFPPKLLIPIFCPRYPNAESAGTNP